MEGRTSDNDSFNNAVGKASSSHDFDGDFKMICFTSSSDTCLKNEKGTPVKTRSF